MCGIVGFSGEFEPELLQSMSDAIKHRGPDGKGKYFLPADNLGLAHRRLSIIDPSTLGQQPMQDATGSVVITYNGEIYNYQKLRRELISEGYRFKSNCDTEVLLNLYLRNGVDMLHLLNGIFAFAIWDKKAKTLFVARDNLGVKPLYYLLCRQGFVFASELKALMCVKSCPLDFDYQALHYYLSYIWCPAPHTLLKNVRKLPPGQAMLIRKGKIQKEWQYYELPVWAKGNEIDEATAGSRLEQTLQEAVKRQLVSDVPLGAFLSGGLDSSAIVALAKPHIEKEKMQCFTIDCQDASLADEGFAEDLPYAEKVAAHLGVELNTIKVGSEMIDKVSDMVYMLDEPLADPASLHVFFISQLAREKGIKVLLSGAGSDDVLSGYRRHYALQLEKRWLRLPKPLRKILALISARLPTSQALGRRINRAFRHADLTGAQRMAGYFHWLERKHLFKLYSPEVGYNLRNQGFSEPLTAALDHLPAEAEELNKLLYLDTRYFLVEQNLTYTDKMSMAAGVEVRVPFLDPKLIDLAAHLPIKCKQNGKEGKWLLRQIMSKYLPAEIIKRPKTGFGSPLRFWLRKGLSKKMHDLLAPEVIKKRGLFQPKAVSQLVTDNSKGKIDASYPIFSLMCIEMWCQRFLDNQ